LDIFSFENAYPAKSSTNVDICEEEKMQGILRKLRRVFPDQIQVNQWPKDALGCVPIRISYMC